MSTVLAASDIGRNLPSGKADDEVLSLKILSPPDPDFFGDVDSLHMVTASKNFRPYEIGNFVDVDPVSDAKFGQKCKFKIGNEGKGDLLKVEVCITLPKVGDTDSATSGREHPLDASYAGSGTFINWQPYIGELIMGGINGTVEQKHGTQNLRRYTAEAIHMKRALCHDNESSNKRAAYENAVQRLIQTTQVERQLIVPLWMAHCTDDTNYHQTKPTHALGIDDVVTFDIPTLAELVQTDVAVGKLAGVTSAGFVGQPTVFLRLHYVAKEAEERVLSANMTLAEGGLTYQTLHAVGETKKETTNTGAHKLRIPLEATSTPTSFLVVACRLVDDSKKIDEASEGNDTRAQPRSVGGFITRPEWTRWQPINAWDLLDSGTRVRPTTTMSYWTKSQMGHVNYFPSTPTEDFAVIPFNIAPTVENHGMGHTTFTSYKKPELEIHLPAIDSSLEGAVTTRELIVIHFVRSHWNLESGQQSISWDP